MDVSVLIDSFADFAKQKNIDRPTMISILEYVFRTMIKKRFGSDENFDVIVNADKGDLEIWRFREIVDDDSEDVWDFDKIPLAEARKIEPDFEVGEEVAEEIERMTQVLEKAGASGIQISKDETERLKFWSGRKNAFPAAGRLAADYYCMDGTIPRRHIATLLKRIQGMETKYGLAA